MSEIDKKALKETEIRTRYITPAIVRAGWDLESNQVRENYTLAPGKIVVRGRLHAREASKFADYVLFLKPGLPLAVVEAPHAGRPLSAQRGDRSDTRRHEVSAARFHRGPRSLLCCRR